MSSLGRWFAECIFLMWCDRTRGCKCPRAHWVSCSGTKQMSESAQQWSWQCCFWNSDTVFPVLRLHCTLFPRALWLFRWVCGRLLPELWNYSLGHHSPSTTGIVLRAHMNKQPRTGPECIDIRTKTNDTLELIGNSWPKRQWQHHPLPWIRFFNCLNYLIP